MENQYALNGRTFSFSFMPAETAVLVEATILRVLGEPLFRLAMTAKDNVADVTPDQLGATALSDLFARLTGDDLLFVLRSVFSYASCDQKPIVVNATFTGRPKELMQVLMFGLRYNFADFFVGGPLTFAPAVNAT